MVRKKAWTFKYDSSTETNRFEHDTARNSLNLYKAFSFKQHFRLQNKLYQEFVDNNDSSSDVVVINGETLPHKFPGVGVQPESYGFFFYGHRPECIKSKKKETRVQTCVTTSRWSG